MPVGGKLLRAWTWRASYDRSGSRTKPFSASAASPSRVLSGSRPPETAACRECRAGSAVLQKIPVGSIEQNLYKSTSLPSGGMPEWLNGAVSKTVVRASAPWVRIPLPPPKPHVCQGMLSQPAFAWATGHFGHSGQVIEGSGLCLPSSSSCSSRVLIASATGAADPGGLPGPAGYASPGARTT